MKFKCGCSLPLSRIFLQTEVMPEGERHAIHILATQGAVHTLFAGELGFRLRLRMPQPLPTIVSAVKALKKGPSPLPDLETSLPGRQHLSRI